ncbi:hypothetical protein [Paraclostridium sordellii]|nr:hypothetical protein [Paeniclostridium sordellii]
MTYIKLKDTINSRLELTPLKEWNINIDSSGNENVIKSLAALYII